LFARSYESGLVLFSLLVLALGGSYTPAIMLVAQHLPRRIRGRSLGMLLTGASLGFRARLSARHTLPVLRHDLEMPGDDGHDEAA
jgi:hypothetical protein